MRHKDRRRSNLGKQIANRLARGGAQSRVESGERLIEQQESRTLRQRSGQGHTLLLSTGQFVRPTRYQHWIERDHLHKFGHAF